MSFFKIIILFFVVLTKTTNAQDTRLVARVDNVAITNIDLQKTIEVIKFLKKDPKISNQSLQNEALKLLIDQALQVKFFALINVDIEDCKKQAVKNGNIELKKHDIIEEFATFYCTQNMWNQIVDSNIRKNYNDVKNISERKKHEESDKLMKQIRQRFLIEVF